jgi:hypothetical protein
MYRLTALCFNGKMFSLSLSVFLPTLVVVVLLFKLILKILTPRSPLVRQYAAAPQLYNPYNIPAVISELLRLSRAAQDGTLHAYQKSVTDRMSKRAGCNIKTVAIRRLGMTRVITFDCVNIHSILALQFPDFGHGHRKSFVKPYLGEHSIVGEHIDLVRRNTAYTP